MNKYTIYSFMLQFYCKSSGQAGICLLVFTAES